MLSINKRQQQTKSDLQQRFPVYAFTICIKVVFLFLFSSSYMNTLFIPFVSILSQGNLNPWEYYYTHHLNLDSFPYHGLMLYILSVPMLFVDLFHIDNQLVISFIFKIPLLVADIILFVFFIRLFPSKKKQIFYFYFLNPIILYSIYIHSQLDIIPMVLLIIGIYFLTIERLKFSATFIGLSLATKFHVLVVLPLFLFYLFKKYTFKKMLIYIGVSLGIWLLFDIPFIFSDGFIHMVLMNPKQSLLFDSYYKIGTLELLLPISAILTVYFHFFNQKKINLDLLFFYFGILFTATIFFIYPAPAWYVWLTPFISIYFIQNNNQQKSKLLYIAFSTIYLIFFLFFYHPEYQDILFMNGEINFKVENQKMINIFFTFLESILLS